MVKAPVLIQAVLALARFWAQTACLQAGRQARGVRARGGRLDADRAQGGERGHRRGQQAQDPCCRQRVRRAIAGGARSAL